MGTQHINVMQQRPRKRRFGFRRLFTRYFLGILGTTFLASCVFELAAFHFIVLNAQGPSNALASDVRFQVLMFIVMLAVPFVLLTVSTRIFAGLMGRKISQPVSELMLAVEKISRQDLNFSINYQGHNELGDLCSAFNELRRELQESLEREWRKQEEMRTMIAALSHDLRTPVTIIQGHVEGLARAEAGEKRNQRLERYLPVLEASSQRMTRLLNDILLVSSLEQTSFIIQPQPVCLEEELKQKAHVYELQAASHEIAFAYSYLNPTSQGGLVLLDLHRVEQVLDNLFENALRYTPAHAGTIILTCTHALRTLSFVLRDPGCGIAPEDLPHVFEKFYHGKQPPDHKMHKAAGLGLYTCKLLVEKHGGTIAVQNHPAGGCEVAVCLPVTTVSDELFGES